MFTYGYLAAMRQTMIMPICLLAAGAISCLMISHQGQEPVPAGPEAPGTARAGQARTTA